MKNEVHMQGFWGIACNLFIFYPHIIFEELLRRLFSKRIFIILYRELDTPFQANTPDIGLQLRTFQNKDLHPLLSLKTKSLSNEEVMDRVRRLCFLKTGIGKCCVVTTAQDIPCHMQWMITHEYNLQLGTYFNGGIPPITKDEVLLEFAFTPESYKDQGIWSWATAKIAEKAKKMGKRRLIIFVRSDNQASLHKCIHKGFVPYKLRKDRWFLFFRKSSFEHLNSQTLN